MATVPQKELRNQVGDVLRRVEAGESIVVTVAGRPAVELRPANRRTWISGAALAAVFRGPAPETLHADLERFGGAVSDPCDA